MKKHNIKCKKCDVFLEPEQTYFNYLNHVFHYEMLKCPKCGIVYIPEEIVYGRMHEVEEKLESK